MESVRHLFLELDFHVFILCRKVCCLTQRGELAGNGAKIVGTIHAKRLIDQSHFKRLAESSIYIGSDDFSKSICVQSDGLTR